MVAIQSQSTLELDAPNDVEVFSQVLGLFCVRTKGDRTCS